MTAPAVPRQWVPTRHTGVCYITEAVAEQMAREFDDVAEDARAEERRTDLRALRRCAVTTELGDAVLLRDIDRILGEPEIGGAS